ncbi:hypothetical protein FAZ95_31060 [Trinickia violacea]|uniref:Uncharacterized protein n=1 Tax=Trinickia violacea TaxID=2571746 RepID=A0A4P8J1D1_9BURK|nr:hypothetical protein [Trinickia violacea]QCP53484.1 hypothetical protein FAZ95_31060 [Trinickia violacea]
MLTPLRTDTDAQPRERDVPHKRLAALQSLQVWARCAPIALIAIFGGTALILCNPGYFWDDWVWRFQAPEQSIRIGRELGIFWGGYLTNAINALPSPALAMRATALVAWVIAGIAAAYVLYRQRVISGNDAFKLFLIYAATHVAMIRFLTSVAMYNVYIASFWIGCACLLTMPNRKKARLLSLPFFFFSFYLNSLIPLFLALLVLLAARQASERIDWSAEFSGWRELASRLRDLPACLRSILHKAKAPLREFALQNAVLLALPIVFALIKRLTSVKSTLYGDYNDVDRRILMSSIFNAFGAIRPVLRDYFATSSRSVTPLMLLACALICFLLLRIAPRRRQRPTLNKALAQAALGWVLFAAAVYPYLIVGKAPELTDFYESRNILPAIAGLALVLISFANLLDLAFSKIAVLRSIGHDLLLGYVIGASVGSGLVSGLDLWRDWIRQTAIMAFVQAHQAPLKDIRTFVFDDAAHRIDDRKLWNYEYTGELVSVYHTRDRLGVSVDEYSTWPPKVALLSNPALRKRFNFGDYQFDKPHAIITVRNGVVTLNDLRVLSIVRSYLRGDPWESNLGSYMDVSMAYEYVQADARVEQIFDIAKALSAYRLDHGHYPVTASLPDGDIPIHELSPTERIGPPIVNGDIPGLFPDYMARMKSMTPRSNGEPAYLYMSDGLDFKLVYANPPDLAYAKQAHPALIDPARPAYGTWTLGAKNW